MRQNLSPVPSEYKPQRTFTLCLGLQGNTYSIVHTLYIHIQQIHSNDKYLFSQSTDDQYFSLPSRWHRPARLLIAAQAFSLTFLLWFKYSIYLTHLAPKHTHKFSKLPVREGKKDMTRQMKVEAVCRQHGQRLLVLQSTFCNHLHYEANLPRSLRVD